MSRMGSSAVVSAMALMLCGPAAQAQHGYGDDIDMGVYGGEALVCSGGCVGTYDKCAGKNIDTQLPCCNDQDQCVSKNSFYAQCRPQSKGIPISWLGGTELEDCITDPDVDIDVCDKSALSFKYETAELLFTTARSLVLLRVVDEEGCKAACVEMDGCVVYEWRDAYIFPATDSSSNDEDIPFSSICSLFDSNTIPNKTQARPRHAGVNGEPGYTVAGVKCYYPTEVCGDLQKLPAVGDYHMADNELLRNTQILVGPGRTNIFTECSNLCALGFREDQLEGGDAGVCSGFAIDGDVCTMLYPEGLPTTPYIPGGQAQVYSIADC